MVYPDSGVLLSHEEARLIHTDWKKPVMEHNILGFLHMKSAEQAKWERRAEEWPSKAGGGQAGGRKGNDVQRSGEEVSFRMGIY